MVIQFYQAMYIFKSFIIFPVNKFSPYNNTYNTQQKHISIYNHTVVQYHSSSYSANNYSLYQLHLFMRSQFITFTNFSTCCEAYNTHPHINYMYRHTLVPYTSNSFISHSIHKILRLKYCKSLVLHPENSAFLDPPNFFTHI